MENCTSPELFSPISLRDINSRNRIAVSPMCQYASVDGSPTDWHLVQLGRFAMAGAGIVFFEETAIEARGRKTYHCAGIWNDRHVSEYRRITDFIKSQGAVPALQIGHAGRKASVHGPTREWAPLTTENAEPGHPPWQAISASPIATGQGYPGPRELDSTEIDSVVNVWAEAARRADLAGFDILEIHGAHGYLLHQFLSPLTNLRGDEYGGDFAGRTRFPLEVTQAVRRHWPDHKPLFFRVSAVDGRGGAWTLDDTVRFAEALGDCGVDVVDVSSGGVTGDTSMPIVKRVPGYQVAFAERVRKEAKVKTMAVGLITNARQANSIIESGKADLVALAREFIWNPNWAVHAARDLDLKEAYKLLPAEFAFRLNRRDEVANLPVNRGEAVDDEQTRLIETT